MNKKIVLTVGLFFVFSGLLQSQIFDPVKWEFSSKYINQNEYMLYFKAEIEPGWSVYSQYLDRDDGPIATALIFDSRDGFKLVGKAEEDPKTKKEGFDPIFEMNLAKYSKSMQISQRVKVLDPSKPITGYLTYMTCDSTKCLPPADVDFNLQLNKAFIGNDTSNGIEKSKQDVFKEPADNTDVYQKLYGITKIKNPSQKCGDYESLSDKSKQSYLMIFVLGLLGGFLALLTPCVFPLIPLTVSFFTKTSNDKKKGFRNAMLYGIFIIGVYILLSVPFHLLDSLNPDILNEISTNVWLNLLFFLVFLIFAFSFFGYYEINMPSSLTNKISTAESVGGVLGIFFMALTLSLVSFSCTGPILGSLLAGALSSDGGAWQLSAGMSGFGLALALPFTLFAMFPGWMAKLPKSGEWLNTVKVVLGFIELALALKFLSNADLVMHWGFLTYELFMVLWILISLGLILYLFVIIKFPHNDKKVNLSSTKVSLGIVFIAFTCYLGSGLFYNSETKTFQSLKLLSGLAPPTGYSWTYPNKCPNGINCFRNLEAGMEYARSQQKPILLDFTGYACVNCRKMEEHVWSDPRIFNLINDGYVLVSLYVDDKKGLPSVEQIEVNRVQGGTRKLKNYGHKWAHFQTKFFRNNSQPYYVAISSDGSQILNNPVGYTPEIAEYEDFLKCGLNAYHQQIVSSN
ncbi:MAG: cytochrome c biogenesis protein CcdA [Bacteroidota bacterium]